MTQAVVKFNRVTKLYGAWINGKCVVQSDNVMSIGSMIRKFVPDCWVLRYDTGSDPEFVASVKANGCD